MQSLITLIALALGSIAPFSVAFAEDVSAAFAAGTQSFVEKDYSRALANFEEARNAGVEGPAIHYNIGACHYRLGDYARAEVEFRLVADRYPAMRSLAEYNLGLVLLHEQRESEARVLFAQAREHDSGDKVAQLATTILTRLDSPREAAGRLSRWMSFVDVNVGHDDNVALIADSSVPAGQSVDSAFSEAFVAISGPLSPGRGLRFDGNVYAVRYNDAAEFDQTAIHLGGAYHWAMTRWQMEAESHFNRSTLDGDGFEQRLGLGVTLKRSLSPQTLLGMQLVRDEVDGIESQFSYLEGSRALVGLTFEWFRSSGRLTLGYQFESNDRASASASPTRNRIFVRYRYAMSPNWGADVGLSLRDSAYDDLAVTQDEDLTELAFRLTRNFARGLHLNAGYEWSDNRASVDVFTYARSRVSVGMTKSF